MMMILEPRMEHLAAVALLLDQPDYMFQPNYSIKREIEIRMDQHRGTVSFYDHLGLPLPLSEIKDREVWAMFNHLFLQLQLNNQPPHFYN